MWRERAERQRKRAIPSIPAGLVPQVRESFLPGRGLVSIRVPDVVGGAYRQTTFKVRGYADGWAGANRAAQALLGAWEDELRATGQGQRLEAGKKRKVALPAGAPAPGRGDLSLAAGAAPAAGGGRRRRLMT